MTYTVQRGKHFLYEVQYRITSGENCEKSKVNSNEDTIYTKKFTISIRTDDMSTVLKSSPEQEQLLRKQ